MWPMQHGITSARQDKHLEREDRSKEGEQEAGLQSSSWNLWGPANTYVSFVTSDPRGGYPALLGPLSRNSTHTSGLGVEGAKVPGKVEQLSPITASHQEGESAHPWQCVLATKRLLLHLLPQNLMPESPLWLTITKNIQGKEFRDIQFSLSKLTHYKATMVLPSSTWHLFTSL